MRYPAARAGIRYAPGVAELDAELVDRVAGVLRSARRVFVVTGAGLSAESGLPTYRGVGGLYESQETEDGFPIEVAMSGPMLASRPEVTWKYLAQIEGAVRGATPSRAHRILAELEPRFETLLILTQNVDGFHRAAGSTRVIDIHGDCHDMLCTGCGARHRVESYAGFALPPRCAACRAVLRPEVVLFEEMLPVDKLWALRQELRRGFDCYLAIGTTAVFPYIAGPLLEAAEEGRPTVEINPGETSLSSRVRFRLATRAGPALEALAARLA